jgi:hypothetical protein
MADLQLEIEGPGAIPATEALLQIPGLTGSWEPASEEPQGEGVLTTIATIVAITAGILTIAEKLHQWYQQHLQASSHRGSPIAPGSQLGRLDLHSPAPIPTQTQG